MGEERGGQRKELSKNGSELEPGFSLGPGGALEWESHHRVVCTLRHGAFHSNVHHCCGYLGNRKSVTIWARWLLALYFKGPAVSFKTTFTHPGDGGAELVKGVRWGTQCSLLRWNHSSVWPS